MTQYYKSICGCDVWTIFNDMHACLVVWRKKQISKIRNKVNSSPNTASNRRMKETLEKYKHQITIDGNPGHKYGVEASSLVMCEPIEVGNRKLNHYSCALGECKNCPKWEECIPDYEKDSTKNISFCVFATYH